MAGVFMITIQQIQRFLASRLHVKFSIMKTRQLLVTDFTAEQAAKNVCMGRIFVVGVAKG